MLSFRERLPASVRRGCLAGLVAVLLGGAAGAQGAAPQVDILLHGGRVHTGADAEPVPGDVAIAGERIVAVGDLDAVSAGLRIDVSGLVVAPGFIDIHSHAVRGDRESSGLFRHPDAENLVRQGVTTVIGGPDGGSWLPVARVLAAVEAAPAAVNFGTFVGHNDVREAVMGRENRAPTDAELEAMRDHVDQAMREGAFGLSSGLKYIPGAYSATPEVVALARVAGAHGGIYITHLREEGLGLLDSVAETIRIAEEAGLPAQITHFKAMGARMWGRSADAIALADAARARGLDITFDQYPYTASSTGISVLFPAWSLAGDRETRRARLADPETRAKIKAGIVDNMVNDRGGNDPARVAIAHCSWDESLDGKNFAEILVERGLPVDMDHAAELAMEIEDRGGCSGVFHAMSEEDVLRILRHPATMIASDGGIVAPGEGAPHPRNYGAFARVLGHYVRDRGVLTLGNALHRMTRMPADRIGLADRGRLAPGAVADLAVFDPEAVADRATFPAPHQYAVGVRHVFVAGTAVLRDGEPTGARPGRALRAASARPAGGE